MDTAHQLHKQTVCFVIKVVVSAIWPKPDTGVRYFCWLSDLIDQVKKYSWSMNNCPDGNFQQIIYKKQNFNDSRN